MKRGAVRILILVYGLLSAWLYCTLLPLWEGFDELYHYAYVQQVRTTRSFPVVGKTAVSRELWTSLDYAPVSHYLQPYFERPTTSFEEYFRLSGEERAVRRSALEAIPRALQHEASPRQNYEAKQAPLTYLLLAPFDRLLADARLPWRVLGLRLILALPAMFLLWFGAIGLSRRLGVSGEMEAAALLVIFSCQMLYGAACHIANDALLIPWLVIFLNAVIDACESPGIRRMAVAAALMAVGVLLKASALCFVPLLFAPPAFWLVRRKVRFFEAARLGAISAGTMIALAGPWYLRNIITYHNFTATDETSGMGVVAFARAAAALPWLDSITYMAHSALWQGNSSFRTFSAPTLDAVLALLGIAAVLYCLRFRRSTADVTTIVAVALYCCELVLITLTFFHASHGAVTAAVPWYMPVLLAPVVLLCFVGLARWGGWGRWLAIATVLLWAYVAVATWLAKLVPLYGGFEDAHARPRQLLAWYLENSEQRNSILGNLCPGPLPLIYVRLVVVLILLVAVAAWVSWLLARRNDAGLQSRV